MTPKDDLEVKLQTFFVGEEEAETSEEETAEEEGQSEEDESSDDEEDEEDRDEEDDLPNNNCEEGLAHEEREDETEDQYSEYVSQMGLIESDSGSDMDTDL